MGELKEGRWGLSYVGGLGLSNESYGEGDEDFSFWVCGGKVRLGYWLRCWFEIGLGSEL